VAAVADRVTGPRAKRLSKSRPSRCRGYTDKLATPASVPRDRAVGRLNRFCCRRSGRLGPEALRAVIPPHGRAGECHLAMGLHRAARQWPALHGSRLGRECSRIPRRRRGVGRSQNWLEAPRPQRRVRCLRSARSDSPVEGTGFEPSVPPRKRWPSGAAPRPTIVVSRDDLCLMTHPASRSGISRRQQPRDLSQERDLWFVSGFLQRRVGEILVPGRRSPLDATGLPPPMRDRAVRFSHACRAESGVAIIAFFRHSGRENDAEMTNCTSV